MRQEMEMGRNVQSVTTAGAVVIEHDACEDVCRVCNEVVSGQSLSLSLHCSPTENNKKKQPRRDDLINAFSQSLSSVIYSGSSRLYAYFCSSGVHATGQRLYSAIICLLLWKTSFIFFVGLRW
jgi:hypothetical protein